MTTARANAPAKPGRSLNRRVLLVLLSAALVLGGCNDPRSKLDLDAKYVNPERLDKGLVVILPGIEGESAANRDIRLGLDEGGVPYALVIYRWGFPIPGLGMLMNQTDTAGDRRAATDLAKGIARYQQRRPGLPVFLVGHSAGGGVAVFALEALAQTDGAKPISGAILLSSSISADYPLEKAMQWARLGLVNGCNPDDTVLLGAGTALFGNVDGEHGDSAGRTGFHHTDPRLFQFKVSSKDVGAKTDPHFLITDADLIAKHAPRWILSEKWPPPRRTATAP